MTPAPRMIVSITPRFGRPSLPLVGFRSFAMQESIVIECVSGGTPLEFDIVMEKELLEVYSCDSNYAVIKPPGRQFPGAVIQGDSLANLARMANHIARAVAENRAEGEEFLDNVQELNNLLVGRVLHYQDVLEKHGIEFPHVHPLTSDQMVEFFADDDSPHAPEGS